MNAEVMVPPAVPVRRVEVEFLYLDLNTCSRCTGTDASLGEALEAVRPALEVTGVEVELTKVLVASESQARALRFASSPTIRVNGRDIAGELKETSCAECGELCPCNGETDCRVWVHQGREHNEAPVALIVDAILGEIYGDPRARAVEASPYSDVPRNLKRFFAGRSLEEAGAKPVWEAQATALCCSTEEQGGCCESSAKASCCGQDSETCGCR